MRESFDPMMKQCSVNLLTQEGAVEDQYSCDDSLHVVGNSFLFSEDMSNFDPGSRP